jgi:hypothetical protein
MRTITRNVAVLVGVMGVVTGVAAGNRGPSPMLFRQARPRTETTAAYGAHQPIAEATATCRDGSTGEHAEVATTSSG